MLLKVESLPNVALMCAQRQK